MQSIRGSSGITHLVHVELALPSSELSVAGREIPNEVMAGGEKSGENRRKDICGNMEHHALNDPSHSEEVYF